MKRFLLIALLLIYSSSVFARVSWVDNKAVCEKTQGNWRLFNNDCGNNCSSKFDLSVCSSISNYSCDCGKNRCWDGDKCASDKVARKFWDKIAEENKAKRAAELDELKAAQELFYKSSQSIQVTNLQNNPNPQNPGTNIAGGDPTPVIDPGAPLVTVDPEVERQNNEKKLLCEQKSGVWKEFRNGCVDGCSSKVSTMSMCTSALTMGCECGETKCWDNNQSTCIEIEDYKKLMASPIAVNPTSSPIVLPTASPVEAKSDSSSTQPITKN
jgi:hypothetical protein